MIVKIRLAQSRILRSISCFSSVWLILLRYLRWCSTAAQVDRWCLLDSSSLFWYDWHWIHRIVYIKRLNSASMTGHLLLESNLSCMPSRHIADHRTLAWATHYVLRAEIPASKFILDV